MEKEQYLDINGAELLWNRTKGQINKLNNDVSNETTRATNRENEIEELFTMPTQDAVNKWLNEHPEATTTVQDHSLTINKIVIGALGYVTPHIYKTDTNTWDEAIQRALDSGYSVYLPSGSYDIYNPIELNSDGLGIFGDIGKSRIVCRTRNMTSFNVTCNRGFIKNMMIVSYFENDEGIGINIVDSQDFNSDSVFIDGIGTGIRIYGSNSGSNANHFFSKINVRSFKNNAFYIENAGDVYVNNFYFTAGTKYTSTAIGINLFNKCESIVFNAGEVLRCKHSLYFDSVNTIETRNNPRHNRFTNIYFDSSSDSSIIRHSYMTNFEGCWFENGWSGGDAGLLLKGVNGLIFTNCQFVDCGDCGCIVDENSKGVIFNSCLFANNNRKGAETDNAGLKILIASNVSVSNSIFTNDYGTDNKQLHGIINGGGADKINICNNQFMSSEQSHIVNPHTQREKISILNNIGIEDFTNRLNSVAYNNRDVFTVNMKIGLAGNSVTIFNANIHTFALLSVSSSSVKVNVISGNVSYNANYDSNTEILTINTSEKLWGETIISYM